MSTVLSALRYSAEHEWVDDASPARIGVSQVAADNLGDVVYLDLPEAGSTVTAGEVCGEIESTKSVSELFSPVTGTVAEVNAEAVENPAVVNEDPYGAGWLVRVEPNEIADVENLMDAAAYEAYVSGGGE